MTCIVGVVGDDGRVWLGGDSAATTPSGDRTILKDPKVWTSDDIAYGVCGSPKVIDVLAHVFKGPKYRGGSSRKFLVAKFLPAVKAVLEKYEALDDKGFMEGALLVGLDGALYKVECNFQVIQSLTNYESIGSGSSYAIGSLAATTGDEQERVLKALEAATRHDAGVFPPYHVVSV